MSRGFVKEDDQEEAPIIPPRAALPAGETNYVTPNGLKELKNEEEALIEERANLDKQNDTERRRAQAVIDGKLKLLRERISTARLLKPEDQPADEVRFGALVELLQNGNKQEFQIVGVDEANVKKQKIAFVAPIAKAVTGKKVGDKVDFKLGEETRKLEILKITY
ncbi:GreA/GreB family elongation factor [Salegentibacter mishustinae]|jgi:transcription elongation factor GreB|uniref:GreA/GreB family elongation factor n=1 Tax=Salegentibacter mishustinae TaxID=270918 RepID=UPI001CE0E1D4|nr:GreA/GreB family elongation factor [Salegentibacter mishustinae]UBZ06458.1 GreA/GreB family elongation factor [Salegentibacter mishustinae]